MNNIPKGYKQTEVGVIPNDWEVKSLCTISNEIGDGIHATPRYVDSSDYFFVNGNNLVDGKILITDDTKCVSKQEYNLLKKKLSSGTVLMSINGTIGNLAFFNNENIVLGKSAAYIDLKDEFEKRLIYYLLQHSSIKNYYENELTGTTIRNLSLGSIRKTPILLPPTKAEQTAIATALSDTDALISKLEELIAKKRNIKQGAMQELLTGKKRLPGFSGKWEVKFLSELFTFSGGFTASREELSDNGFCYLHYGDIHNSNKTYIDVSEEYANIPKLDIPISCVSKKSLLNDGDIVFVDASEDDEGASRHIVVRNSKSINYISGLHTIVSKSKDESLDNIYKEYCFQTSDVKKQFKFYAVGIKVSGISKTNIAKIQIPIPPKTEQVTIAKILSDMDAEIEQLEQKLDKYRMIKQGMMQELLTGKIRLL